MPKANHLRVVDSRVDEESRKLAREFLSYDFEAHVPAEFLKRYQAVLNASSYSDIIKTTAPERMLKAGQDGVAYMKAWEDLTTISHFFVYDPH